MSDFEAFSKCLGSVTKSVDERAIGFLFYRAQMSDIPEASVKELVGDFLKAGFPNPKGTRLKAFLARNRATTKVGIDKWRIRADEMSQVGEKFSVCLDVKHEIAVASDSVIPRSLVQGTKNYIEEVTRQINVCYDYALYDASGVMIRRLVETLIIETYEAEKIQEKIKDKNGNYFMLEALINTLSAEKSIPLGRNAKKGLNDAKWLGDQSAHNRRFIAVQADIDRIQPNIRILVQELITIAKLK